MTKSARIQIDRGQWQDCEFSFSEVSGKGYVLRVISPYRITLAILDDSQAKATPTPAPQIPRPQNKTRQKLYMFQDDPPATVEEFAQIAPTLDWLAWLWPDIKIAPFMASVSTVGELVKTCEAPGCSNRVTGVTALYCSQACKQAAYRLRKRRNKRNKRNKAA